MSDVPGNTNFPKPACCPETVYIAPIVRNLGEWPPPPIVWELGDWLGVLRVLVIQPMHTVHVYITYLSTCLLSLYLSLFLVLMTSASWHTSCVPTNDLTCSLHSWYCTFPLATDLTFSHFMRALVWGVYYHASNAVHTYIHTYIPTHIFLHDEAIQLQQEVVTQTHDTPL